MFLRVKEGFRARRIKTYMATTRELLLWKAWWACCEVVIRLTGEEKGMNWDVLVG